MKNTVIRSIVIEGAKVTVSLRSSLVMSKDDVIIDDPALTEAVLLEAVTEDDINTLKDIARKLQKSLTQGEEGANE